MDDREKQIQDYCKICFTTDEGRTVLEWLKKKYHDDKAIFRKESSHETAYRLGKRDLVGDIIRKIEEKPNKGSIG